MVRLRDIFFYFLYLGTCGFGGPIALAHHIKKDLVDKKGWLTEQEYLEGLALTTTLPGPIAFQLGVYAGWLKRKFLGGTVAGIGFIITPFLLCVALGFVYQKYRAFPWMDAIFYGVTPVVLALIWNACWNLARTTMVDAPRIALFFIVLGITYFFHFNFIYLLLAAGIAGAIYYRKTVITKLYALHWPLFIFFFKAGLFIFGSGLVIVPFLQEFVVQQYHWLSEAAFLDSVAVGMVSPGPVLITATFVGFLTEGFGGAVAATAGIFLPSFLLVFAGAPLFQRFRYNPYLQGFVKGITVAVVAVIAANSLKLVPQTVLDWPTGIIAIVSLSLLRLYKIPDPVLVLGGAILGVVWKHFF